MPLDPRVWLSDVLEAGQLAQQFAAGLTFEQYEADLLRRSAVERQLTILGEAVVQLANLTPSVTFSVPGMIGFRNFLIHRYARVDQTIVWAVLRDDVPVLLTEAQQFLQQLGS